MPLLLNVPQTLCDVNYVNNADIATMDDGLHFLIYPANDSSFTVYDGTSIRCQTSGNAKTVTLTSVARRVMLQIRGNEPSRVELNGVALDTFATRPEFDAADIGRHYDAVAGFSFVKFPHPGESVQIALDG